MLTYRQKKVFNLLFRFNTSGTLLFSAGCDNKLFAIDVRLSKSVEKAILKPDQRLISDFNKRLDKFEPGFHILGYIGKQMFWSERWYINALNELNCNEEFEGELVCLDTFDYINDQNKINTRVVLGIHDVATWELIDNKTSSNNQIQIFQVEPSIDRLKYFKSSLRNNYDLKSAVQSVKLASKVLTFELNLEMFDGKFQSFLPKVIWIIKSLIDLLKRRLADVSNNPIGL